MKCQIEKFNHPNVRMFLGDIRDKDRLLRALEGIDIVVWSETSTAAEYNLRVH